MNQGSPTHEESQGMDCWSAHNSLNCILPRASLCRDHASGFKSADEEETRHGGRIGLSLFDLFRSREFVVSYLVFLVLTSTIAWVVANPPRIDQFSSVSVLGPDMTAASYFPGNSTTVAPNVQVN